MVGKQADSDNYHLEQDGIESELRKKNGVPKGIRTPVTAVKGRCPRPLDDGDCLNHAQVTRNYHVCQDLQSYE